MDNKSSSEGSSFEFEFWMVDNPPSFPHPTDLLTADELFADGILLPLHPPPPPNDLPNPNPNPTPPPHLPTKKWKNLFKTNINDKIKNSTTTMTGTSIGSAAELNIYIWPFSRSRSTGRNARPRAAAATATSVGPLRKSSSAPAASSSSRSRGGGVHVGRSAPVWRLGRARIKAGGDVKCNNEVLSTSNCVGGSTEQVSCGSSSSTTGNGRPFNLRTIFSKKVVLIN